MIAVDLLVEWLVQARHKLSEREYAVCLLTFLSIQATGIEVGMLIGILLSMMAFVVSYSQLQKVGVYGWVDGMGRWMGWMWVLVM